MADIGDRSQDIEPGDAGHMKIEEHQIRGMRRELTQCFFAIDARGHVEAFLQGDGADQRQNRAVIVNDEQTWAWGLHS